MKYYKFLVGLSTLCSGFALLCMGNVYAVQTQMSISLVHSYSGDIVLQTGSLLYNNTMWYSNSPTITVDVWSSDSSTYFINGDLVQTYTGSGIGAYTTQSNVHTTVGDGPKYISGYLLKDGWERINASTGYTVFVDTTAPSIPTILTLVDNTTVMSTSSGYNFSRTPAVDTGVGLLEYQLVFDNDPTFTSPFLIYQSVQTGTSLSPAYFPQGTIFWYIQAIDKLGNTSQSAIGYFHVDTPSSSGGGGGAQPHNPNPTLGGGKIPPDNGIGSAHYESVIDCSDPLKTCWPESLTNNFEVYNPYSTQVIFVEENAPLEQTVTIFENITTITPKLSTPVFVCDARQHNCDLAYGNYTVQSWLVAIYHEKAEGGYGKNGPIFLTANVYHYYGHKNKRRKKKGKKKKKTKGEKVNILG